MKPDDGVDETSFIKTDAKRAWIGAAPGNGNGAFGGSNGQSVTKVIMRIDEGGARKMQPHHLHQHLV